MANQLKITTGQYSDKGKKRLNQDFHGILVPPATQQQIKGVALALADGISTSSVSQVASETAVKSFLSDYFCTSDAWSARTSGTKVVQSVNGWLYAQSQQSEFKYNKEKGYVCTFSALVFKSKLAHIFHVGDSRIYRVRHDRLEQLTKDHRSWTSSSESYLSRALGVNDHVAVDYHAIDVQKGDYFLLCTDGVYEFCGTEAILAAIKANPNDLEHAAKLIVSKAFQNGSDDNLTIQVAHVEELPDIDESTLQSQVDGLALPPLLQPRQLFDGHEILRELHSNSRSHVYLAKDIENSQNVIVKIPSVELRGDPAYLERFLIEEWVARRINNAHVMKAGMQQRERKYLYSVTEYIEGITLKQWLIDNPKPSVETVRGIVEQVARGLQALHRKEVLHQDLKPDNIMIDVHGTVKIIDFGGVRVAGLVEAQTTLIQEDIQGTALYTAPEYFVGQPASQRSDMFSLAVITYQMLSGRFPYGTQVAKTRTIGGQRRLKYQSVLDEEREIPAWMDFALKKALHPNPFKRYEALSEFVHDLRYPNSKFLSVSKPPLIERNPLLFWKSLSFALSVTVVGLLILLAR